MYTVAYRRPAMKTCHTGQNENQQNTHHKNRYTPPVNVQVTDEGWTLEISLPGYKKEEITTRLEENVLVIEGKREQKDAKYARREWANHEFTSSFRLPAEANAEAISASMDHGVLMVFIPKKEKSISKIEVQ